MSDRTEHEPGGDPFDEREPAMPEVMRAVRGAVRRRSSPRSQWRRRALRGTGLGLVIALAGGTALAASGQWHPFRKWDGRLPPTADYGPPPADQMDVLAVLRRDQTDDDRSALVTATLRLLSTDSAAGVHVNQVRVLRPATTGISSAAGTSRAEIEAHTTTFSGKLILIPAARWGHVDADHPTSSIKDALCLWSSADTWPDAATPAPDLWAGRPPKGARPLRRDPDIQKRVTSGGTCGDGHQLRTKGLTTGALSLGTLTGLVPDGVATVRATTSAGVVMSDRVVNNSYQLQAPWFDGGRWPGRRFKQGSLQWVAADGHVLRTF